MKISVCIPMYNEAKIISDTAKALSVYMKSRFEDYEILFSDDGSTDGSAGIVRSLGLDRVSVTGYKTNRGKGCAVRTAMLEADGDVIIFTDADLAYGTGVIGTISDAFADRRTDMVIGSRNLHSDGYEGYTFFRRAASKLYIKVLCLAGGLKLSDSQTGCKGFSRRAAREIFSRCEVDGFAFDFEAILWAQKLGFSITELPVKVVNHRASKVHVVRDAFNMLKDLRIMKKRINKSQKDTNK